jgi:hypothetical protein
VASGDLAVAATPVSIEMGDFNAPGPFHRLVRPREFKVGSVDSSVRFWHLRWAHWGAERAVARGRGSTFDGDSGKKVSAAVTLTASALIRRKYARVVVSRIPLYRTHALPLPVESPVSERCAAGGSSLRHATRRRRLRIAGSVRRRDMPKSLHTSGSRMWRSI